MSSAQLSALISLQQNDYATLAILTAVAYDYMLTFSDEIEYIWNRRWTQVSTLFIFVRYLGILNLITCSLLGSSFLPGPEKLQGEVIYTIDTWVFYLFLGAADYVMSLRVWALYNKSRLILGILLAIFSLEIISSLIGAAMDSKPRNVSAPIVRIMDDSFCLVISTPVWSKEATVIQMTHGAVLCLLTIIQFVRELITMYNLTKQHSGWQWRFNHLFSLLVMQGIFYFFALFLYNIMTMLSDAGKFPMGGWKLILLVILNYVPVFTLTPRFIISIRALDAHIGRASWGEGTDSGFGLGVGSAIVFANFAQNGGLEVAAIEEVDASQTV